MSGLKEGIVFIRDLMECEEIISGDRTVLRELLHPDKADLKLQYSLAHANTNFFYMRDKNIDIVDKDIQDVLPVDLFQHSEIRVEGGRIILELKADGAGRNKFNEWSYSLSECLDYNWDEKSIDKNVMFKEINGNRKVNLNYNGSSIILVVSDQIEK